MATNDVLDTFAADSGDGPTLRLVWPHAGPATQLAADEHVQNR
jgi:hypothetical protein